MSRWKTPQARQRSLMALADNRTKRWVGHRVGGPHCHPLVNLLVEAMNEEQISFRALGKRAGVSHWTIQRWRSERNPSLPDIEAALNALGIELKAVKRRERLAA